MSFLYSPQQVIREIITTKDGEITVNLNLTIKLDQDGGFVVRNEIKEDKKTEFLIPEIEEVSSDKLVSFGKNV